MRLASVPGGLHRLLPVALCALGAHAVLYRSLLPATGRHSYFSWYEPLVAGLSLTAVLVFAVLGIVALTGGGGSATRLVRLVLPVAPRPEGVASRTRRLALASLAFLIVQESCERMLASHAPALASLGSGEILVVLAVLTLVAWLVALVERSCANLIEFVLGRAPASLRRQLASSRESGRPRIFRRRHPLSEGRGLRAPPLPA